MSEFSAPNREGCPEFPKTGLGGHWLDFDHYQPCIIFGVRNLDGGTTYTIYLPINRTLPFQWIGCDPDPFNQIITIIVSNRKRKHICVI